MARPQIEDGHTNITNEIMDALMRTNFTGHERRLLDCILRKTYGWNKKLDRISYSQFAEATGIDRRHIGRALSLLKRRRIIICVGQGYSLEYGLQKDYELWDKIDTISGAKFDTKQGNDLTPSEGHLTPSQVPNLTPSEGHLTPSQVPNLIPSEGHLTPSQVPNLIPSEGHLTPSQVPNLTPSEAHTKAIKHIYINKDNKNIEKGVWGEFQNIFLSEKEFQKLIDRFGEVDAKQKIETLSAGIASKGYKYKDHYATILNWSRLDEKRRQGGGNGNGRGNSRTLPARDGYTDPNSITA